MPHLQELWSELQEQRDDVVILCVNGRDKPNVISSYWTQNDFGMTALREKRHAASRAYGIQANPTNYVIGPDGKVLWRGVGFTTKMFRDLKAAVDSTRTE